MLLLDTVALKDNTTGCRNVAVGRCALHASTTGLNNTAVGFEAMKVAQGASNENTSIGYGSGCTISTGDENAFLGYRAGYNVTTGNCNILLGSSACIDSGGTDNSISMEIMLLLVGNNAMTFGNGSTDSRIAFGAQSTSAPSDLRLKEDIEDDTAWS